MNEIIDLGIESFGSGNGGFSSKSEGGGGITDGIELLMNNNRSKPKIRSSDLDNLEQELNELSDINLTQTPNTNPVGNVLKKGSDFFSSYFGNSPANVSSEEPKIGEASASAYNSKSANTWDGFTKLSGANFGGNDDEQNKTVDELFLKNQEREKGRKKRTMLKKLEDLQRKGLLEGVNISNSSSFEEIEDEYNFYMEDKLKIESVKLQKQWFKNAINTLEMLNASFNPFDLDLQGWGEQVSEDIDEDDELFAELYEKYKGGKFAPEVKLILKVVTTAFWINMTNKLMSSAIPNMGDVMRQNPEVMKTFMNATVDSLNKMPNMQNNPMINMATEIYKNEIKSPEMMPNMSYGPPPAPVETKTTPQVIPKRAVGGPILNNNRPDIVAAKRGGGVEINSNYSNVDMRSDTRSDMRSDMRPEMRGPSVVPEVDTILNLKRNQRTVTENFPTDNDLDSNSNISIQSLTELARQEIPTRRQPKRRNRSEKSLTSITLDI